MDEQELAAYRQARRQWIARHRETYLRSGGVEGHIASSAEDGGHPFTPHCLIRYTGRSTGRTFATPLICGYIGGEVVIVGSKGGAPQHPDWYLNLRANDRIDFQVATQAFRATWREPQGAEREKVWNYMIDVFPPYARYQAAAASRQIPVVMMKAVESIPAFTETDATGVRQAR